MTKVILSPAARGDLERIDDYTVRRFGLRQARKALDALGDAFEMLASFPASAPRRPEFDPPGRSFRYHRVLSSLLVVYDFSEGAVRVARILDARREDLRELLTED